MKKFLAMLSVILILVSFTNEANAEVKQDNTEVVFECGFVIPTMIDNVVVVSSVENVVASVMNYIEVGGSNVDIVNSDLDNSNLYSDNAIALKIYNLNRVSFGGERVKLIKQNVKIASNDKVGNITANVGKLVETYIV